MTRRLTAVGHGMTGVLGTTISAASKLVQRLATVDHMLDRGTMPT